MGEEKTWMRYTVIEQKIFVCNRLLDLVAVESGGTLYCKLYCC